MPKHRQSGRRHSAGGGAGVTPNALFGAFRVGRIGSPRESIREVDTALSRPVRRRNCKALVSSQRRSSPSKKIIGPRPRRHTAPLSR